MILRYQEKMEKAGGRDLLSYVRGRPAVAEAEMALKASYLGGLAGAFVNIAHVCARDTVKIIRARKSRGESATGETCPH